MSNIYDKQYDVVVIGGGPAGSLAATYLAQAGYKVVLFEKKKHPRFNVGENLIPDFWKFCNEAGVSEKIKQEKFVRKAGGIVNWHGEIKNLAFNNFGYSRPALHVERDRFDFILLENAKEKGVTVIEEAAVQKVQLDGINLSTVFWSPNGVIENKKLSDTKSKFVIDASGQSAILGRQLGTIEFEEKFRFMSVWGYFENSYYLDKQGNQQKPSNLFEIPPVTYVASLSDTVEWGWSWQIILKKHTSVGLVLPQKSVSAVKAGKENWNGYFLQRVLRQPILGDLLRDANLIDGSLHIIRDYSYRSARVAGPGFFMVGDAAGFIDPIFSVGVVLAMYTAHLAAWSIDRIFRAPSRYESIQQIYTEQVQARLELGRRLALPNYGNKVNHQAKKIVDFSSDQSKSLMYAAALMTNRAENFDNLVDSDLIKSESVKKLGNIKLL